MFKSIRFRPVLGVIAAILGVAALAYAVDPADAPWPTAPGCWIEDAGWASSDGGCKDLVSGKVWSMSGTIRMNSLGTWGWAFNYCDTLDEGGFQDWRLPTLKEIQTAVSHDPPHHWTKHYSNTWSSQTKGNKAYFQSIDNPNGQPILALKSSGLEYICVRP